ncbi:MAG: tetratricopeptide repeat protein [gamma proteobacterium symbiont of Bathyaustriella thionipta]|nr:tetratricopeptide repeat protein [gamma proteobacterium symbiont of Bathyaustriella thionipta]MCU7948767.1 tetratricopeptide repeat protein [gamma proteobacterium symbiont of Bathyaustriella thionipta]MCU7954996.1 tetratricopeptide repeat protein [gamma proteobacterium symbiont of Bathyaustriella thionipta]MCU7955324.1 tetratricopeptide repeat protein [gamma proteobacterium symbiont of Bathyaustriella thionipta]MCU7967059.1 tetratricopeptide repeat protein [gamma proteobacterium symbiont of 
MSKEVLVFEVNQKSFDQYVLLNSHKIPVIVEFMGVWSGPCIAMDNILSGLAKEFAEQFIFAKIDMDEQAELVKAHKIENVPTLMVFTNGELARTEVGELKENEIRELLKDFGIYHTSDLIRDQAREKHIAGETSAAIVLLTNAIKADPANTRIAMDMVQIFIDIGELEQASSLYTRLPDACHETEMGKALNGQLIFATLAEKVDAFEILQNRLANNPADFDALFDLSVCLIAQYQYQEAMDNLFNILQKDPEYKNGAAKEMVITVSNMLAPVDSELAQDIRRKLANLLAE